MLPGSQIWPIRTKIRSANVSKQELFIPKFIMVLLREPLIIISALPDETFSFLFINENLLGMKTLKIFMLCMVAACAISSARAQNPVIKEDLTFNVNGQYYDCLGEYIGGDIVFELMYMSHNVVGKLKKGTILGYSDANGAFPSGNIYEVSQVINGAEFNENALQFRLNGKIVLIMHVSYRVITNANGDVTATIDKTMTNCKD